MRVTFRRKKRGHFYREKNLSETPKNEHDNKLRGVSNLSM